MQILYSGEYVDFEPLTIKGEPVFERIDGTPQIGGVRGNFMGEFGTVRLRVDGRVEERAVIMRARRPEPGEKMNKRADGMPHRTFSELYVKPNGNLFHFPVVDDPTSDSVNQQTVQCVIVENGRARNIYKDKGFKYASAADVERCLARAEANAASVSNAKKASDPSQQIKLLTEQLAAAMQTIANASVQAHGGRGGK